MQQFGYTLYCEGNDPKDLVRQAILAEEAGFDFLVISDHYHPWLTDQAHAGFAWSILGSVAQATERIHLATMVTCPIMRYHPAIIAQAAATVGVLSDGRFTLGLGAGERLNEHIVGEGWPSVHIRHKMLREAITIIQKLWQGGYQSFEGEYFKLDDARIFDLPEQSPEMFTAAGGPRAARLAADMHTGVCITEPKQDIIQAYLEATGVADNTWGQVVLSWDTSEEAGLNTAYRQFRFSAGGWKVQAELPNPINFDAATKTVQPQGLADSIPAGPDPQKHASAIRKYIEAGVRHLAVAYPGSDPEGFMKFWQEEMRPALADLGKA
jgi:G6PDH family F420-dependent oxidoreductase